MEPPSPLPFYVSLLIAGVLGYRFLGACLLEALRALPALQRRRLLEEDDQLPQALASRLETPFLYGLSLSIWNRLLLVVLLGMVCWRMRGLQAWWLLAVLAPLYIWLMDGLFPVLLTHGNPVVWLRRLHGLQRLPVALLSPLLAPAARVGTQRRERLEREMEEEEDSDEAVTALLEEGEAEGILEADDRELIRNVMEFGDTVAREVMTPRTLIKALPLEAGADEVWALFRASRHSRLPVFQGAMDQIVGVVLLKDLLQGNPKDALDLRNLIKPAVFVPESKPVQELLRELQRERTQLAVVVDEFGSVSGLVTMEDLLEEVFGEIREEHEAPAEDLVDPQGVFVVPGAMHVEELEQRLGVCWEREGFDTVAGLVLSILGRLPEAGETLQVPGATLSVLDLDGSRILRIRVAPSPDGTGSSQADV